MRIRHHGSSIAWGAACSVALACGSPDMPVTTGSISLFASADQIEVAGGGVQEIGINVVRSGGFGGDVLITVDSAPGGIRALIGAEESASGMTSDLLTFAVDAATPVGEYTVRFRASAFGVADAFDTVAVQVESPGAELFSLQARPLALQPGDSASTLLSINRANFGDVPVSLDLLSAPEALHAEVSPSVNSRALSRLSVHADASLRVGVYDVIVRGKVTGHVDRVAVVPVNVLAGTPAINH